MKETHEFPFWGQYIVIDFNLWNQKTKRERKETTWNTILDNIFGIYKTTWPHSWNRVSLRSSVLSFWLCVQDVFLELQMFSRLPWKTRFPTLVYAENWQDSTVSFKYLFRTKIKIINKTRNKTTPKISVIKIKFKRNTKVAIIS